MDVDQLVADVNEHIANAPIVTLDEWGRQSIRRLEQQNYIIQLLVAALNEQDNQ